jgi:hypothetical protein
LLYDPSGYKLQELQSILQVDPMTDAVMASQAEVSRGHRKQSEHRRSNPSK